MSAVPAPAVLRAPTLEDGPRIHELIAQCPPLDTNSRYCNLLQCHHFADTSIVATTAQTLMGAITGYCLPSAADTLFVWQVAVHPDYRGQGLAHAMLSHLLDRVRSRGVVQLETTITLSNTGSWSLFKGLARELAAPLNQHKLFDRERHLAGVCDSEYRVVLGPFDAPPGTVGTTATFHSPESLPKECSQ